MAHCRPTKSGARSASYLEIYTYIYIYLSIYNIYNIYLSISMIDRTIDVERDTINIYIHVYR